MGAIDDARLATFAVAAAEVERAVRFHLETNESPGEQARGWEAYRNASGLRQALDRWIEMRRWKAAHASETDTAPHQ